jgi:hypothetical protein
MLYTVENMRLEFIKKSIFRLIIRGKFKDIVEISIAYVIKSVFNNGFFEKFDIW